MTSETVIDQMADKALQYSEERACSEETILYLSNGGVLKVTPPRSMVLTMLREANPEPRPPRVEVEVDGRKTFEENPHDPKYREQLEVYNANLLEATMRAMLYSNVEILKLPKGVLPYDEDDGWVEELEELFNYTVPTSKRLRYLTWMRYCILGSPKDIGAVRDACENMSGTTEEEIAAAEATFQD